MDQHDLDLDQEYEAREEEKRRIAAEARADMLAEVLKVVDDVESEVKAYFSKSYCADGFGEIRSRLAALSPTLNQKDDDQTNQHTE